MILVDTGAWVGLMDKRDHYHSACRAFFRCNREPLITTYPVLVESVYLLYSRIGAAMTLAWFETLAEQGIQIFPMNDAHLPRLLALMRQYADLPMDLADASLVLLAEERGEGRIISTDERDFHAYRWKNRRPFHNLLWEKE